MALCVSTQYTKTAKKCARTQVCLLLIGIQTIKSKSKSNMKSWEPHTENIYKPNTGKKYPLKQFDLLGIDAKCAIQKGSCMCIIEPMREKVTNCKVILLRSVLNVINFFTIERT